MLDRPNPTVPVLLPKLKENQSPVSVKAEMYPLLPPPPEPETAMTTPLPHGVELINEIYYQQVRAPHNVVVAQSSAPAPTIVPCAEEATAPTQPVLLEPTTPTAPAEASSPVKRSTGLEFAMPEMLSPKKSAKKVASWSCSNSRQHEKRKSPLKTSPEVRPTSRGCGRKKVEMSNAPIIIQTTHSHLLNAAKSRPGLTISFATDDSISWSVKTSAVQHLSPPTTEAAIPLEVNATPTTDTAVTFEPSPVQDDSDMELETSEVRVPTRPPPEPSNLVYKLMPRVSDYEIFAQTLTAREAPLWDLEKVRLHADLFFQSYF